MQAQRQRTSTDQSANMYITGTYTRCIYNIYTHKYIYCIIFIKCAIVGGRCSSAGQARAAAAAAQQF